MYPLKFEPNFKDYLWGGRNLARFGKQLPLTGIVAESWEVSGHTAGPSVICNGVFAGKRLTDLIGEYPAEVLGGNVLLKYDVKFPLLVKLIDANQQLSVQVHPDDAYALTVESDFGKHEIWYIIEAKPDAQIIYGLLPGITKTEFIHKVETDQVESCLQYLKVRAGDVIDIPPGTIHALGGGIILAEIQQNSNATYRVYDYHRVDATGCERPLHIDKALEVIDFTAGQDGKKASQGATVVLASGVIKTTLAQNAHFQVDCLQIKDVVNETTNGERFYIYTVLAGSGNIAWAQGKLPIKRGETVLIPAALGQYQLSGSLRTLKSFATTKLKIVGIN
jgi:mannose-6-phosphate isomerase